VELQPIFDVAEICYRKGVTHAIISPGSRNAPLITGFARHPKIITRVIFDERTAGFIGLGMALKSKKPVVLICTSGTAAANYYPSVAEAFFQEIPLLVLTADRPPEWIGQQDGQTIYQQDMYEGHVKKSYHLPVSDGSTAITWHIHRSINEAINLSISDTRGPVHVNFPFREPFYTKEAFNYSTDVRLIDKKTYDYSIDFYDLVDRFIKSEKRMILVGQCDYNKEIVDQLNQLGSGAVVIGDVVSNVHDAKKAIIHHELFLKTLKNKPGFSPDFLISFGQSVVSKPLKKFLRAHPPASHAHISSNVAQADTFQSLTEIIDGDPLEFLKQLNALLPHENNRFFEQWQKLEASLVSYLSDKKYNGFSEFEVYKKILDYLPGPCDLHLANSMAVRYASMIGLKKQGIEVFCNRGTSGIDGTNGTTIGAASLSNKQSVLLTGDLSFFYDRNAFYLHPFPQHLKVFIINNQGGGIFRLIEGPSQQPELEEFFEARTNLSAKHLAEEIGVAYLPVYSSERLNEFLQKMFSVDKPFIVECFTNPDDNKNYFEDLNKALDRAYRSI